MTEYLFRDNPGYLINLANQKGSVGIDISGKELLDFVTGWSIGNAGWKNPKIQEALKKYDGPTYVQPDFYYQRWEELAKTLSELTPSNDYKSFRTTGGTEAVEVAIKISKAHNGRQKFIAFDGAYHGQSINCMALVGLHEKKFGPYGNNYIRLGTEWKKETNKAINAIETKEICAFIAEPIICNLGVLAPPKDFFKEISKACKKNDTVFIMDEVMTGFGRTGKWFGFEHFNLDPDILTLGKGFSSGHAPIGATMAKGKIAEAMRFDFSNYSSYGWHPLGVEAAIANINYIKDNGLVKKSVQDGKYFKEKLSTLGETDGRGLCIGLATKKDTFQEDCLRDGLILARYPRRTPILPPLTVKKEEIDKAFEIMKKNY